MSDIEVRIGAHGPILRAFMRCRAGVSLVRGPLGSGKTTGAAQRILKQAVEQPPNRFGIRPTRWLAVRNTYLDLTQTTIKDFLAVFEGLGEMHWGGLEPPHFNVSKKLDDGTTVEAEVIFLALDRADAVRKLKGYQVTGIWFNEVSEIAKLIFDMADLRHGRYPSDVLGGVRCGWHGMLGDTNSYDTTHWLYELELKPPQGWEFFVQPGGVIDTGETDADGRKVWRLNPQAENLPNLPDAYYERGMRGKDDSWIAVFLANEIGFTVQGKPVHPLFLHSRHVAKSELLVIPRLELFLGVDYGRTPASLMFQYDETRDRYFILDEMPTQDMSASVFAPQLFRYIQRHYADKVRGVRGWGDPAGDDGGQQVETTCIDICRAAGLPIEPAPSNVPALRRAALDGPLQRSCMDGGPSVLVSPKCETFIKGMMGGYHYREMQIRGPERRYFEKPEKNFFSHICEAGEYGFLGAGEGRTALQPAPLRASAWDDDEPVQPSYRPLGHL